MHDSSPSRRTFLKTAAVAAGAAALPTRAVAAASALAPAPTAARSVDPPYLRVNATGKHGTDALDAYERGVRAMLKLPPTDARNWFRNAFVHLMDCPHGNWWFYVWHRGYLVRLEEIIRELTHQSRFALPYWDWSENASIPQRMFLGALDPTSAEHYGEYTASLERFKAFIGPTLEATYYDPRRRNAKQFAQLVARGIDTPDKLWTLVMGKGVTGDQAFAVTANARYLSMNNPMLDEATRKLVAPDAVASDLQTPVEFAHCLRLPQECFASQIRINHHKDPTGGLAFSLLEGNAHNKTHNNIGGMTAKRDAPFGYMTNNLSPVDPVFFLHHANMDRLWDVWTRKQQHRKLPTRPGPDLWPDFAAEPFAFFSDAHGDPLVDGIAKQYFDIGPWQYGYEPGTGEEVVAAPKLLAAAPLRAMTTVTAQLQGSTATATLPAIVRGNLGSARRPALFIQVTLGHPGAGAARDFEVYVVPPGGGEPVYAGGFSFFGAMGHAAGAATFAVPFPTDSRVLAGSAGEAGVAVTVRVIASSGGAVPALERVEISPSR